jgi:mannose-6-phosphate isomerase
LIEPDVTGTGHDEGMAAGETDERPWGSFTVLDDAEGHKVKKLVVHPGRRLSYQRHARRSEHWFVVQGRGLVVLDGRTSEVTAGTAVDVPVTTAHRIENNGTADLVFIEVQHGDYFGEDDIVRLEDDFGRVPGPV